MNKYLMGLMGLITVVALLFGCGKKGALEPGMTGLSFQGTKPGAFAASVVKGFLLQTGTQSVAVRDQNGSEVGTLSLTQAKLALKEIKFKKTGEASGEISYQGPYIVDLIESTVTPALPAIRLSPGTYERIELKLAKLEDGQSAADDVLAHRSIYLAGTYTGATSAGSVTDMPFVLSFELDEEFQIGGQDGIVISETEPNPVLVAFRLSRWLSFDDADVNDKGVDFSQVVPAGGEISLTDQSNGDNQKIWEVIRRGVKLSADCGKDSDDDGVLSSTEDSDADDSRDN